MTARPKGGWGWTYGWIGSALALILFENREPADQKLDKLTDFEPDCHTPPPLQVTPMVAEISTLEPARNVHSARSFFVVVFFHQGLVFDVK